MLSVLAARLYKKICTDCDVKIDIEEDGHVFISGLNSDKCNRALQIIESIVKKPQIGEIYTGRVTRIRILVLLSSLHLVKKGFVIFPSLIQNAPKRFLM